MVRRNKNKNKKNGGTKGRTEYSMLSSSPLVQYKRIDISLGPTGISSSGFAIWLTGLITGGSTMATRVGNRIHITGILVDGFVTGGDNSNCLKVILTKSLNGQQASPTFANWFLPLDGDSHFTLNERRVYTSNNSAATAITKPFKIWRTFGGRGLPVLYDSTSSNAEISPRLQLVMVSDSIAAPDPTVNGYIRVFFTDA